MVNRIYEQNTTKLITAAQFQGKASENYSERSPDLSKNDYHLNWPQNDVDVDKKYPLPVGLSDICLIGKSSGILPNLKD